MKNKKFDREVAEKGLIELLELKLHDLGIMLEVSPEQSKIQVGVDEYQMARELAKSIGMNTEIYDKQLKNRRDELKRYGVEIK